MATQFQAKIASQFRHMTPEVQSQTLTLAEAAALVGVSVRTLQQAARSGTLKTTQSVAGYRVSVAAAREWQATRRPGRPRKTPPGATPRILEIPRQTP